MIIKERLDKILVNKGLAYNSTKAKAIIMSGKVLVNGKKVDKSGLKFPLSVQIRVISKEHNWVSRGGIKLSFAIEKFGIDVKNKVCIDIGSSTGGFTEVLLKSNAKRVYCLDVGRGQLDWKLVNNSKVVIMDKTNIKNVSLEDIDNKIKIVTCDVSFISITKALVNVVNFKEEHVNLIALIKPQFELSKNLIGKNGIVTNSNNRLFAVNKVKEWFTANGWVSSDLIESPIKGAKGNTEYFIHCKKL